jgi:hypothetical protein
MKVYEWKTFFIYSLTISGCFFISRTDVEEKVISCIYMYVTKGQYSAHVLYVTSRPMGWSRVANSSFASTEKCLVSGIFFLSSELVKISSL